ncbi:MAG: lytic murein transglycosylase [Geminicoccaceae bacterium]|nr:MAG: lytic murein transglycosylase [Geminicoccaceae bacterium]
MRPRPAHLLAVLLMGASPAAAFETCVAGLERDARARGVPAAVVEAAFAGVERDERVLQFSTAQPEFVTPIWDYLAFLVDDERIEDGRRMLTEHRDLLARIEASFGVDRHVVLAIWGVESDYGRITGSFFIPHALSTLVCAGTRRQDFWRGELMAALQLVARGDVALDDLRGSWAGAFGQTQFIPSSYARLAVDFDGDGRRDLVRSIPDALASTANYLQRAGWQTGRPWMIEVKVPANYTGPQGRRDKVSLDTWSRRGVVRADGAAIGGAAQAGLLLPAGPSGPGFLVFANFDAIFSYNHAESYALAIAHLADRIAGYPALRTPWPTDDPGLSRAERRLLQERLLAAGIDIGTVDGRIGPVTRAGIREAEARFGLPVTGRPGRRILDALGG